MWTGNEIVQYGGLQTDPKIEVRPIPFLYLDIMDRIPGCIKRNQDIAMGILKAPSLQYVPNTGGNETSDYKLFKKINSTCTNEYFLTEIYNELKIFVEKELRFAHPKSKMIFEDHTGKDYYFGTKKLSNITVEQFVETYLGSVPINPNDINDKWLFNHYNVLYNLAKTQPTIAETAVLEQKIREKNIAYTLQTSKAGSTAEQLELERLKKVPEMDRKVLNVFNSGINKRNEAAMLSVTEMKILCPNGVSDNVTESCQKGYVKDIYKIVVGESFDPTDANTWNINNFNENKESIPPDQLLAGYCKTKAPFIETQLINAVKRGIQMKMAGITSASTDADIRTQACPDNTAFNRQIGAMPQTNAPQQMASNNAQRLEAPERETETEEVPKSNLMKKGIFFVVFVLSMLGLWFLLFRK